MRTADILNLNNRSRLKIPLFLKKREGAGE